MLELTVLLFPVRDGRLAVVLHKTVVDWLTGDENGERLQFPW